MVLCLYAGAILRKISDEVLPNDLGMGQLGVGNDKLAVPTFYESSVVCFKMNK